MLSSRIKARRDALRLSQEALAALVGTNQGQISRYEKGTNQPTSEVLLLLANALETSTDYLLGLTEIADPGWHGPMDLSDDERRVIQIWRSKASEDQQKLLKIMKVV